MRDLLVPNGGIRIADFVHTPHRREVVKTPLASTEGTMIETSVPLLAIPLLPGGLHLWEGARQVLPNADLCLDGVPSSTHRGGPDSGSR